MNMDRFKRRVWDKKRRRMHYGDMDNLMFGLGGMLFWQFAYDSPSPISGDEREDYIPMGCTGFKDSEGNLIYESDIVRIRFADERNNYISPVMWKYGAWCIYHENRVDYQTGERACVGFGYWTKEALKGVTLLGNIYQDPSLLEAEK